MLKESENQTLSCSRGLRSKSVISTIFIWVQEVEVDEYQSLQFQSFLSFSLNFMGPENWSSYQRAESSKHFVAIQTNVEKYSNFEIIAEVASHTYFQWKALYGYK